MAQKKRHQALFTKRVCNYASCLAFKRAKRATW